MISSRGLITQWQRIQRFGSCVAHEIRRDADLGGSTPPVATSSIENDHKVVITMQDLYLTINRDGGFTFNPRTGRTVGVGDVSGYAVAVPGTEHELGSREQFDRATFTRAFMKLASAVDSDTFVGAWHSTDRDTFMVEFTKIHDVDRDTAIALGVATNQEAIFDLATGETIFTGGTGDQEAA